MSLNVDVGLGDLPDFGGKRAPLDAEGSALLHTSEEAPAKGDIANQLPGDALNPIFGFGDDDLSGHCRKDASLHRWRAEGWVRDERKRSLLRRVGFDGPEKGVGQHAQHVFGALIVLLAVAPLFRLLRRIMDEGLDAAVFLLEVGRAERLAVLSDLLLHRSLVGFD